MIRFLSIVGIMVVVIACCYTTIAPTPTIIEEDTPLPTPASTLTELIQNMSSDRMDVRRSSIYELRHYGDDAVPAIPALISNLKIDDNLVQLAAIDALKDLGIKAKAAVSDLVYILHNDSDIHARSASADALGFIGDQSVIPDLVIMLYWEHPFFSSDNVQISCAKSIARITGEKFTDYDSRGYTIDENGIPLIVIDAREWWQEEGKYQNWEE